MWLRGVKGKGKEWRDEAGLCRVAVEGEGGEEAGGGGTGGTGGGRGRQGEAGEAGEAGGINYFN